MLRRLFLAVVVLATLLGACGGGDGEQLTVYAGRNENLIRPILERFAESTGIDVHVRYAETSELVPTLLEEASRTRADVFISQDAGALAELSRREMFSDLPQSVLARVPERFRDPGGMWVGLTARSRVIAYNTKAVKADEVPRSVLEVVADRWRGRVGIAPTNASFVAHVSAIREALGNDRVAAFLAGLRESGAKRYDSNVLVVRALAAGEIDLGLVNHYYVLNELRERPSAPVANSFPEAQGFVNVSGAAVMRATKEPEPARRLVEFLLADAAQRFFRDETLEYPLARTVEQPKELPALDGVASIDVPLSELGADLRATVELIKEAGLS